MSDTAIIRAPEGVEIDLVVYLVSDSTGLELRVGIRGLPILSDFKPEFDPVQLARHDVGLPLDITDWRVMTRDEIRPYKRDEDGA